MQAQKKTANLQVIDRLKLFRFTQIDFNSRLLHQCLLYLFDVDSKIAVFTFVTFEGCYTDDIARNVHDGATTTTG
jgi:hypothetical protein